MSTVEPAKVTLTDLRTAETLEVQFNPTVIGAKVSAAYADLKVLGSSGMPQQFEHVTNVEVPLELYFCRTTTKGGGGGGKNFDSARRFLWSILYPSQADTVLSGGPPDVLFVWPNVYSFVCRMRELEEHMSTFASSLAALQLLAKVKLHRFSQVRLLSEDIRKRGLVD